jgi:hypothetical protein
LPTS